jgi:hypothetical protein
MLGKQIGLYMNGQPISRRHAAACGLLALILLAACGPDTRAPQTFVPAEEQATLAEPALTSTLVVEPLARETSTPAPPATPTTPPATVTPQLKQAVTPVNPTPQGARRISPDVLLPGISWGGGGGGGCSPYTPDPTIILIATESDVYHQRETDQVALGGWLTISGCGFPPSEMANYTFRLPDGSVDSNQVAIDEVGGWYVEWWSLPGEPLGEYGFDFASSAGLHTVHFTVYKPTMPVMTGVCRGGEAAMVLTGFAPGEEVLLGRYVYAPEGGFTGNLAGYDYVLIGPDGTAVVNPPPEDAFFVAVGQSAQTFTTYEIDGNEIAEIAYQASVTNALTCLP